MSQVAYIYRQLEHLSARDLYRLLDLDESEASSGLCIIARTTELYKAVKLGAICSFVATEADANRIRRAPITTDIDVRLRTVMNSLFRGIARPVVGTAKCGIDVLRADVATYMYHGFPVPRLLVQSTHYAKTRWSDISKETRIRLDLLARELVFVIITLLVYKGRVVVQENISLFARIKQSIKVLPLYVDRAA